MACDCASILKEGIKKQDEGIRTIIENAIKEGHSYPVGRAILFLIDIIKNGSKKEKTSTKSKNVAIVREETRMELSSYFDPDTEFDMFAELKESDAESNAKDEEKEENIRKDICFEYKFDKCPHEDGIGCQNRHPKKCQAFCDFGHKALDKKGCETQKCELMHPKLCRNSTKFRECYHRQCRFQHLKGTKIVSKREFDNARTLTENGKSEHCEFMNKKIEKLIDLITISIQLNQERKT